MSAGDHQRGVILSRSNLDVAPCEADVRGRTTAQPRVLLHDGGMAAPHLAAVLALVLASTVAGCSGSSDDSEAVPSVACGDTVAAPVPVWAEALVDSQSRYAVSSDEQVVVLVEPTALRSGTPKSPNTVTWIIRTPVDSGDDLIVNAHPHGQRAPFVSRAVPLSGERAHRAPFDVPTAGCWTFEVGRPGGTSTVDLVYR